MATHRRRSPGDTMTISNIAEEGECKIRDAMWDISMVAGDISDRGHPELAARWDAIRSQLEAILKEVKTLPRLGNSCTLFLNFFSVQLPPQLGYS